DAIQECVDVIDRMSKVRAEWAMKTDGESLRVLRLVGLRGKRGKGLEACGQCSAWVRCRQFRRHARENSGNGRDCHARLNPVDVVDRAECSVTRRRRNL
ncbi:MAG: hypothetical protein RL591_1435, partial [Planctomycetota bacterium]